MQELLQITFRGMEPSAALEQRVRELVDRFDCFREHITSFHVTIQAPHQHHHQGTLYNVRVRIGLEQGEVNVDRNGTHDRAHEDPYVAVRDAFNAADRQLQGELRRRADHRRVQLAEAARQD